MRISGADVEWLMDKLNLGWIVSSDVPWSYQFVALQVSSPSSCPKLLLFIKVLHSGASDTLQTTMDIYQHASV